MLFRSTFVFVKTMESFLFREKNTLLDYTELQLLPFVAPVCNAEVSIVLFSKSKNLKETA